MRHFIFILTITSLLFSCGQNDTKQKELEIKESELKLSNNAAEDLIRKTLKLPKNFNNSVGEYLGEIQLSKNCMDALQADNLITYSTEWHNDGSYIIHLNPTDQGRPYYIGFGQSTTYTNTQGFLFKTHDIDFDQITGVSINKESQTAIIRFSVKATNITPVANSLSRVGYFQYSLDAPISGELIFKKFDNGWQLESSQNKSALELLNHILGVKKY